MFRLLIAACTIVIGLGLSSNAFAKEPVKKDHTVKEESGHEKRQRPKKSRVQADDQSASASTLDYHRINDCLKSAGVQWKGMKRDPKTGEYVLEGPKKGKVPQFYLVMGKTGLYRINTSDLKDNSLLDVTMGESKRRMGWGQKDGLWVQASGDDTNVPARFKDLEPVAYEAKAQQYDKIVQALISKPVRKHYQAGIQTTLNNAATLVSDSRKPIPEIVSEMDKMNAIIAKYKDQEAQLRTQFQNGALTRAQLDSQTKLGKSLVGVNQAGLQALAALQAQRETRAYTPSEKLMAYQAVDAQWAQSPLKAGATACQDLLGKNLTGLFPKADPYGVAHYARLRLFGAQQ